MCIKGANEDIENIIKEAFFEVYIGQNRNNIDMSNVVFFGSNGVFESISLVSFLILIEEKIQDFFNVSISLTNEKALSNYNSPFKNMNNLCEYIEKNFFIET